MKRFHKLFASASGICLALVGLNAASIAVRAQELKPLEVNYPIGTRFITTSASGQIEAPPDRAIVTIGVQSWDKDLNTAYAKNDSSFNAAIAMISKYHVDSKDIQTIAVSLTPTYGNKGSDQKPQGYEVYKSVTIVFRNMDNVPALLVAVVDTGTNHIESVKLDISKAKLDKYKEDAISEAVQIACKKAAVIAGQLKARVGKVLLVTDTDSDVNGLITAEVEPRYGQSNEKPNEQFHSNYSKIEPGQLKINASVKVTFELTD